MAAMGAVRLWVSLVINIDEGILRAHPLALFASSPHSSAADDTSPVGPPGVSTPLTFSPYLSASMHYEFNSISPRRTLSVPFVTAEDTVDFVG